MKSNININRGGRVNCEKNFNYGYNEFTSSCKCPFCSTEVHFQASRCWSCKLKIPPSTFIPPAGFFVRSKAFLIDLFVVLIVTGIPALFVLFVLLIFGVSEETMGIVGIIVFYLALILFGLYYFCWLPLINKNTIGKKKYNIRVVDIYLRPLTLSYN